MPTYYPTGDGDVTFHQFGCPQHVTADGLTIDSPTCEALVEQGALREGDATSKTKQANVPSDGNPVDYPTRTPIAAPAAVAKNLVPPPPAPDAAQPSGPAATDTPPKES